MMMMKAKHKELSNQRQMNRDNNHYQNKNQNQNQNKKIFPIDSSLDQTEDQIYDIESEMINVKPSIKPETFTDISYEETKYETSFPHEEVFVPQNTDSSKELSG